MSLLGTEVTYFTAKDGRTVVIRYPKFEDAPALMTFINTFSLENGFTRFAGEQMTLEEEQTYLRSELEGIEKGDVIKLFAFVGDQVAGVCDVHRDLSLLTKKTHTGVFGIIVAKEFRGIGLGETLMSAVINEATTHILGLKMIKLDCFSNNTAALSLYAKLGFTEVGRIPKALRYGDTYVDEVSLIKEVGV